MISDLTKKGDSLLKLLCCFALTFQGVSPFAYVRHATLSSARRTRPLLLSTTTTAQVTPKQAALQQKRIDLSNQFCSYLDKSLRDGSFRTFTLIGPSGKRKKNDPQFDSEELRGCFKRIHGRNVRIQNQDLVQVTFKYHLATDLVQNWDVDAIDRGLSSLLFSSNDADVTSRREVSEEAASEWGSRLYPIGSRLGIQRATLETLDNSFELEVGHKTKRPVLRRKKVINGANKALVENESSRAHDRTKNVPVSRSADFLQALGVTNSEGKPRPGKTSKLRQIQKMVEIVSGLIKSYNNKMQQEATKISTIDMGCGRGYLTFALHAFLKESYLESTDISTRGIDVRPKLVAEINSIADSLGETFSSLQFETGTIEGFLGETCSHSQQQTANQQSTIRRKTDGELEILIALHACDTATDDALWAGIRSEAAIICVAPCCQKEIRQQIDNHAKVAKDHPMADVLKFGIYRERMTETVTDAMRALLLEMMGYTVNVFEFIGGEHTSKNVMITAVKTSAPNREALRSKLKNLASFHGVTKQKLASWMKEELVDGRTGHETNGPPNMTRRGLPSL